MNKIILITGSTSGIGKALAFKLAETGATIVMVVRDAIKGNTVKNEIFKKTGNQNVDLIIMDLKSQQSIRAGVLEFKSRYNRLDILINQAGFVESKRTITEDGIESMFAVNYLAYYMLFNLLIDELKASEGAKVLNVSGGIEAAGTIDFDDLQSEKKFSWFKTLGRSKLADILFTYEADRKFGDTNICINAVIPTGVKTDLGKNTTGGPRIFMTLFSRFFTTPEIAAEKFANILLSPELNKVSGKCFKPDGKTIATTSKKSYDEQTAKKLWEVSRQLTKMDEVSGDSP